MAGRHHLTFLYSAVFTITIFTAVLSGRPAYATILTAGDTVPAINTPGNFSTPSAMNIGNSTVGDPAPNGSLTVDGGSILTSSAGAALGFNENGTATLSGAASTWNFGTATFNIGLNAGVAGTYTGTLNMSGGAQLNGTLLLGSVNADGTAAINLDGAGTKMTLSGVFASGTRANLVVGNQGNGAADVTNGAKVEINAVQGSVATRFSGVSVGGGITSTATTNTGTLTIDGAGSEVRVKSVQ